MRLSELSDRLHIAPRSTTEVIDALESRGLIQRQPDPGDRRATLVEVTGRGASVLDAIRGTEAERVQPGPARPTAPTWPAFSASSATDPRCSGAERPGPAIAGGVTDFCDAAAK